MTINAVPGDVFVGTSTNGMGTIYQFAPDGTQSAFAAGLNGPTGLAFDSAGYLFVSDYGLGVIFEFAPDGTRTTFTTQVSQPTGLAFDPAGNLFEGDYGSGAIFKFAPDSSRTTFATRSLHAWGLAFDHAGNLFEADFDTGAIYKFTPDGTRSTFAAALNSPVGLAFDSAGYLFVADYNLGGAIYKFAPNGTHTTFATALAYPQGLAFDAADNLFVVSYYGTIYKITPDGNSAIFATVPGNPTFVSVQPPIATPTPTPPQYAAQVQQPINPDGSSVFNVRRGVVPAKFTLTLGGVATCTLPQATIVVTRTAGGTTGPIDESIYTGPADTGSNFRIDSCHYIYNLSSGALGVGTYRVDIKINNQVLGNAAFQLK